MQGKGGVGKTYIASLIAQYLIEQGEPVVCLDTDMVNATFRDLKALKVEPVDLFKPNTDEIDVHAMDGMVERFVTEDTNFVVDNGATSFVPLSRYLVQDGIADTLEAAGRKLVIHAVIAGGQEMLQTGKGFDSIAKQFPPSADIVLWLNEHHGTIGTVDAGVRDDAALPRAQGPRARHRAPGSPPSTDLRRERLRHACAQPDLRRSRHQP